MKPFIWWSGSRWFVTRNPQTGSGWEWTAWPGTDPLGYRTLTEAYGATVAALTLSPS